MDLWQFDESDITHNDQRGCDERQVSGPCHLGVVQRYFEGRFGGDLFEIWSFLFAPELTKTREL